MVIMLVFPSLFAVIVDESENCATGGNWINCLVCILGCGIGVKVCVAVCLYFVS